MYAIRKIIITIASAISMEMKSHTNSSYLGMLRHNRHIYCIYILHTNIILRNFATCICSRTDSRIAQTATGGKISSGWFMNAFYGENRLNRVNSSFSLNDTSTTLPFLIGRVFGNLRVHSSLATGDYPCRFAVCLRELKLQRYVPPRARLRSHPCNQTMLFVSVLFIESINFQ